MRASKARKPARHASHASQRARHGSHSCEPRESHKMTVTSRLERFFSMKTTKLISVRDALGSLPYFWSVDSLRLFIYFNYLFIIKEQVAEKILHLSRVPCLVV